MIYGSVCSGIEAATVAWHPLGWQPAFFSEIEKFPSAVLKHHYNSNMPDEPIGNGVPNYGDMTKFERWPDCAIDILVGGTPCQSFSIAGLRGGLDDERGNLMLTFAAIARRYRPRWLVWENVPGVLSSDRGRDFASLLGLLSGKRIAVPGKWKNAGYVTHGTYGYGLAWRVLDAQYVRVDGLGRAVPQRRRRVFVVGYLGDWRRAAAVLFERQGLCGNPAPCRKTGQEIASTLDAGLGSRGQPEGERGHLIFEHDISGTVSSKWAKGSGGPSGDECQNLIAFNSREDPEVTFDRSGPLGSSSPQSQAIAIQERATSDNPNAGPDGVGVRDDGTAYTLEARQVPQAVAFMAGQGAKAGNVAASTELSPTLRASESGLNQVPSVAYGFEHRNRGDDGRGYDRPPSFSEGVGPTLGTVKPPAVSYPLISGMAASASRMPQEQGALIPQQWSVRRLMPVECERLQGFPDKYTQIPWRNKDAENCSDGPRYKALGNSMAVNVMRWIGQRIDMMEQQ